MSGVGASASVLGLGLVLAAAVPVLAQKPSPSPSPAAKETPSYTSDDLDRIAGRKPGEVPKPERSPQPEADAAPAEGRVDESETTVPDIPIRRAREGSDDEGPDPALGSWAERAQALRDAVTQAEEHVKDLDSQAQALLWQYLQSTDTNEILSLKAEQQEILDQLPDARKAVADAQKALEDFEKEAAKAGVPPGELREKKKP
jgi:hypothetical protein